MNKTKIFLGVMEFNIIKTWNGNHLDAFENSNILNLTFFTMLCEKTKTLAILLKMIVKHS